jgi:putative FmdB family regulatory protein
MPIYEYKRPDGTIFEVMQKFEDDALTVDPETGVPVQRVLSAPSIHFKGKGFHNTDYGTRRRNRELEKSASDGADKHSAKRDEGRNDKAKSDSGSSSGSSGSASGSSSSNSSDSSSSSSGSSSSGSSSKSKSD